MEALTNAARHSSGDRATITLCVDGDAPIIEVRDDGRPEATWSPGVGLTAMRERAEMLGGTITAEPGTAGGVVSARLPLAAQPVEHQH